MFNAAFYVARATYNDGDVELFRAGNKNENVESASHKRFRHASIRGRTSSSSIREVPYQIADNHNTFAQFFMPPGSSIRAKTKQILPNFETNSNPYSVARDSTENVALLIFQKNQIIGKVTMPANKILEIFTSVATNTGDKNQLHRGIRAAINALIYADIDSQAQIALPILHINTSLSRIKLRTKCGRDIMVSVNQYDKVERIRLEAARWHENSQFILSYRAKRLNTNDFIYAYNIKNDDFIMVNWRSYGGGGPGFRCCLSVDLSKPTTQSGTGKLVKSMGDWDGFLPGLNLLGHCSNAACPSNGRWIYFHHFYSPQVLFTEQNNCYQCPACNTTEIKVETFLVCAAKAKFLFKKCGESCEETQIIEAPSASENDYSMFVKENLPNDEYIQYDFIEITTTQVGMSFDYCQICQRQISMEQKFITECGRTVHKDCVKPDEDCIFCKVPEFSEPEVEKLILSDEDKTVQIFVSSCTSDYCSRQQSTETLMSVTVPEDKEYSSVQKRYRKVKKQSTKKLNEKFEQCFSFRRIASKFQCSPNSKKIDTDLQRAFISTNLPALMKDTRITPELIAKLLATGTISYSDEQALMAQDKNKQVRELYAIVETRIDGIEDLCKALKDTKQSGALRTLSNYFANFD